MYHFMKGHGKDLIIIFITFNIVFSILLYIFSLPAATGLFLNLVNLVFFFTNVFILVRGVAKSFRILSIFLVFFLSIQIWYSLRPEIGHWAMVLALIHLFLVVFVIRVHVRIEKLVDNCLEKKRSDINGKTNPNAFPFGVVAFPEAERTENFLIFSILHILGSAGLITFSFFDKLFPIIASVIDAGLIITFFLFIYGVSVLFLGYIKGMVVPIFIITFFGIFIKTNDLLINAEVLNLSESIALRIIFLVTYTLVIYYIINRSYWRYLIGYPVFTDDRDLVGVYMLLADYLPVAGYDDLLTFSFGIEVTDDELSSPGQIRRIEHILNGTQKFCYRKQVLFAGYRISLNAATMKLFFYSKDSISEAFKTQYYRLLSHYTDEEILINHDKDNQYLVFKNELFPNDYQLQEMYAQIVYDKCAEEGFDFDEQYEIQYLISLNNEKDLVDCEDDLRKEGFLVRRTPEEDFYDEDFDLYFLTLTIEHTSNIGIERLKYNTKTVINIISKYDGNLENWNVLGDEYENQ